MLSTVGDGESVGAGTAKYIEGIVGVDEEEDAGVDVEIAGGVKEERFIADCRGGDGARVDDECVPLVNNRETEAVAVDVLVAGVGAGVRGMKFGALICGPPSSVLGGGTTGCSSKIFRKLCIVSFAT